MPFSVEYLRFGYGMSIHTRKRGQCFITYENMEIFSLTSITDQCDLEKAFCTSHSSGFPHGWREANRFREYVETKMSLKPKRCCCYSIWWVTRQGKQHTEQTNTCKLNKKHSPGLGWLVHTGSLRLSFVLVSTENSKPELALQQEECQVWEFSLCPLPIQTSFLHAEY